MPISNSIIRQHVNTFTNGLDTDTVSSFIKPNTYKDAQNVSLVTNGQFFSLSNIQGTSNTGTLPGTDGSCNIIGCIRAKFSIGTATVGADGILIFGYDNINFKIWGAIVQASDPTIVSYYEMYEEPVNGLDLRQLNHGDVLIDGVAFSEIGYDNVYYTDNYNEPRKVRCVIPDPYVRNFLKTTEIGLTQRKAIGKITGLPATGGTLLTGTYQIAYQLYNPEINKYTRFSLLSNPIHVYTSDTVPKAGIGLPSSSKITTTIIATADEAYNYTHFRIALVKNIYAEGTEAQTLNTVGITKNELISTYTTSSSSDFTTITYDIKSDAQYESITIDEIVTDLLEIDHIKTLTIKRNRLLLGNITLKNLDYDHGNPIIGGGSILTKVDSNTSIKDTFTNPINSTTSVGYFRDEVYRFAISYFDKFGNFSAPKALDLSSISGNAITVPVKDFKFPKRDVAGYTILNSSNQCRSLGLTLTGITNHPSWAVGFVILRAKRKKRIQFQTPILPIAHIYLPGAVGSYPTLAVEFGQSKNYTTATPVGPLVTGVAFNMFHGAFNDTTDLPNTTQINYLLQGEPQVLQFSGTMGSHIMLFPDSSMYTKTQYVFQGNETFETIDAALMNVYITKFSDNSEVTAWSNGGSIGQGVSTSVSASFFATESLKQYLSSSYYGAGVVLRPSTTPVTNAKFVENLSSGTTINGFNLLDPTKFTTPVSGAVGYPFSPSRTTIAEILGNPDVLDTYNNSLRFYYTSTLFNTSVYDPTDSDNEIIPLQTTSGGQRRDRTSWTRILQNLPTGQGLLPVYLNVIELANIIIPQNDNRYGGTDDFNEYILTGTQVNFTLAEQASIQSGGSVPKTVNVWGGDCFVSYHTFKVSDTVAEIINSGKTRNHPTFSSTPADLSYQWEKTYTGYPTFPGIGLHYPVFFKNASQYITLALESEYIGSVRDFDTCEVVTTQNNVAIWGATQPYKSRAPMGYNYNINLKKQNDQKIFVPLDPAIPIQLSLKARLYYSDQKIYNTLVNGFDIIRTGNYYDYEERYGRLVKLAQAGDNLYGIQDRSIFYIPLNERILEVTNASQLAVRSGDFLGLQSYLSTTKGSQALQSIVEQGKFIYGVDVFNKQVFKIEGQQLSFISDNGMISKWQTNLTNLINPSPEFFYRSFYDYLKDEFWIWNLDGRFCQLWNEDYQIWTTNLEFPAGSYVSPGEFHIGPYGLYSGVYVDGNVFLISSGSGPISGPTVGLMYNGEYSKFFDTYVTPSVTFIINPDIDNAKVFDNLLVNSTDRLRTLDLSVARELVDTNQSMTTIDLTNDIGGEPFYRGGEGGYMLKSLRDSTTDARMRGLYSTSTLKWNTQFLSPMSADPAIQVGLISVVTSSRLSSRTL